MVRQSMYKIDTIVIILLIVMTVFTALFSSFAEDESFDVMEGINQISTWQCPTSENQEITKELNHAT